VRRAPQIYSLAMRQVILIGDSIRMGYEPLVRQRLTGVAQVWSPAENGGPSTRVLENLQAWALSRPADVIHINCGLHDLKTEFGATSQAVPLDQYRANVEAILRTLQRRSGATLIWATITPVNEDWHHRNKEFDRFERDVATYNDVASAIARRLSVSINDLHGLVVRSGRDRLLRPDGVHFTPEGYEALAGQVAGKILAALDGKEHS